MANVMNNGCLQGFLGDIVRSRAKGAHVLSMQICHRKTMHSAVWKILDVHVLTMHPHPNSRVLNR